MSQIDGFQSIYFTTVHDPSIQVEYAEDSRNIYRYIYIDLSIIIS